MTSLFQALINVIEFFLSPLFYLIRSCFTLLNEFLIGVFDAVCTSICFIINEIIHGFAYVIDRLLVLSMMALQAIAPANGFFNNSAAGTSFVSNLVGYGAYGITWVMYFINLSVLLTPFVVYIAFLFLFTAYRFAKSWIPGMGS